MKTKRVTVVDELGGVKEPMAAEVKLLLTDREAATALGVSRTYVRQLVALGKLPRVELPTTDPRAKTFAKPSRLLRLSVRDLEAFISRSKR